MPWRKRCRVAALALSVVVAVSGAQAADGTWSVNTSGNWSTTSNWSGGTVADGADFTADFSTVNLFSNRIVTLNSSRAIGNLIFGDSSPSHNWTLAQTGGSVLTLDTTTGTPTIRVNNQTTTVSLELAGADGMTKEGAGTLILTGANTYTGTTTITAGTLTLGSGGSLASSSALAFDGSGIFNFSGAAAATQTFSGLNVNAGFGTVNNTVAGTTLTFDDITRSGSGMVGFATTTGDIITTAANTNGIIGTWAFVGTGAALDYAVSNGAGVAISGLGAATILPSAGPGAATTNYTLAGAQTQTANTVGNTLRYTGGAGTLDLGATSLGLSGLMNAGAGLLTIDGTAGSSGLVTTGVLDIASNGQGITISSVISGAGSVVYGGPSAGILTLSGVNTYTGGTTINEGILRVTNDAALGNTSGAVTVQTGGKLQLDLSGGTVNVANNINLNGGDGLESNRGHLIVSGAVTLLSNSTMSAENNSGTDLTVGDINLGSNTLTASAAAGTQGLLFINGTITGDAASGIRKTGNGPLTILNDQTSTYAGTTSLAGGSLLLGDNGALGTGTLAFSLSNDQSVTIRSSDATARTFANGVTLGGGNANSRVLFGGGGSGDLTFTGDVTLTSSGQRGLQVFNNTTTFDGGISGATASSGISKDVGTGTLVLNGSNSYTGATTVNAGTLLVNGSLDSGSAVTVAAGATLGGGGVIGGDTTISGILSPGSSTESLAFGGNLLLQSTANTIMEINGVNRGSGTDGYDAVDLTNPAGILTYDGTLTLTMTGLIANGTYELFAFTAPAQGAFDDVVFAGAAYSGAFSESGGVWTATSDQGQVFAFDQATGNLTVVPEPSAYVLLTVGLMTVMFVRRKRSR